MYCTTAALYGCLAAARNPPLQELGIFGFDIMDVEPQAIVLGSPDNSSLAGSEFVFSNLVIFTTDAQVEQLIIFLGRSTTILPLQRLEVFRKLGNGQPRPDCLMSFAAIVAQRCPNLKEFALNTVDELDIGIVHPQKDDSCKMAVFSPLLTLDLALFSFEHWAPLILSIEDAERFGQSWRNVSSLFLNPCPRTESTADAAQFGVLLKFAQHCPKLTDLRLFVDLSGFNPATTRIPRFCFRNLLTFVSGMSDLPELSDDPAVLALGLLFEAECRLWVYFPPWIEKADLNHVLDARSLRWSNAFAATRCTRDLRRACRSNESLRLLVKDQFETENPTS